MNTRENLQAWLDIAPEMEKIARNIYYNLIDEVTVCPSPDLVFRALELVHPNEVKVVLLGQDPYHSVKWKMDHHGPMYKANGLAFGYNPSWSDYPDSSMQNIIIELENCDLDPASLDTSLWDWARQGVLLLNTRLTVEAGKPLSHSGMGWEGPVSLLLDHLIENTDCVFLLWGNEAKRFAGAIEPDRAVYTSHPCKYSASAGSHPFLGSKCFQRVNKLLTDKGKEPIQWVK